MCQSTHPLNWVDSLVPIKTERHCAFTAGLRCFTLSLSAISDFLKSCCVISRYCLAPRDGRARAANSWWVIQLAHWHIETIIKLMDLQSMNIGLDYCYCHISRDINQIYECDNFVPCWLIISRKITPELSLLKGFFLFFSISFLFYLLKIEWSILGWQRVTKGSLKESWHSEISYQVIVIIGSDIF